MLDVVEEFTYLGYFQEQDVLKKRKRLKLSSKKQQGICIRCLKKGRLHNLNITFQLESCEKVVKPKLLYRF